MTAASRKKVRDQFRKAELDKMEAFITHGGDHPEELQEGIDTLEQDLSKSNITFNSENARILNVGVEFCLAYMQDDHDITKGMQMLTIMQVLQRKLEKDEKNSSKKVVSKK